MRYLKFFFLILLIFFGFIFFYQNVSALSQSISIKLDLYKWQWSSADMPFYVLTLVGFLTGAILTLLYFIADKIRAGCQIKEYRTKAAKLEQENGELKSRLAAAEAAAYPGVRAEPVVETISETGPEAEQNVTA